jgi:peptidoglycan hydrolase-like protein with peptidoglycan-binding domain
MNPMGLIVGLGVLGGGYLAYKKFNPGKNDFQTLNVIGQGGVPIMVATPVSNAVTVAQATATPQFTTNGSVAPVPTSIPGVGITFAPPGTLSVSANGNVLQPAPIIISPGGAASVAVGSVKDVQHALNTLGFAKPPLTEDGNLGPMTIACIKAFQSKNKLMVDGNAGPATRAALSAALSNMAGIGSSAGAIAQNNNVQTGTVIAPNGTTIDTSAALTMSVTAVQHALNLLGTSPKLEEDGNLGPRSVAAIKSFQTAHGLVPDGVVGAKTKTAIYLATVKK